MNVIVKKFEYRPPTWNSFGQMDHLMGKTVDVDEIFIGEKKRYKVKKDNWILKEEDVILIDEIIKEILV